MTRKRLLALAGALFALGIASLGLAPQGDAGFVGTRKVLLGSRYPSWLPLAGGVAPSIYANFSTNQFWYQGVPYATYSAWAAATGVVFSRGSSATDLLATSPSGASFNTYASNAIRDLPSGYLAEGASTNELLNSGSPATQTTASLGTGFYTLWVNGSGNATTSAGTATGTGFGTATQGNPTTFHLSVAGTVTVTVSGSLNEFQLEPNSFPTSYIPTAGATASRSPDSFTIPVGAWNSYKSATGVVAVNLEGLATNTPQLLAIATGIYVARTIDIGTTIIRSEFRSGMSSVDSFVANGPTVVPNSLQVLAQRWDSGGNSAGAQNGILFTPTTNNAASVSGLSYLGVGTTPGNTGFEANGFIKYFGYFPSAASNSELVALSSDNHSCVSGVTPPSLAQANGLTCLQFYDNFSSLSTFDTTNSGAPGYNWYGLNYYDYPSTPSSMYGVSGNTLTLNDSPAPGVALQSAAPKNVLSYSFVGKTFTAPFYMSYDWALNSALAPGSQKSGIAGCSLGATPVARVDWPTIWFQDQSLLADQTTLLSRNAVNRSEIDELEIYVGCPSGGSLAPQSNVHYWFSDSNFNNGCGNSVSIGFPWDGTVFFHEEMVVLPPQYNGGTGKVVFYQNGTQTATCTWLPSDTFGAAVDMARYVLITTSGFTTWPIQMKDVEIWGLH